MPKYIKKKIKPVFEGAIPKCATKKQYDEWHIAARSHPPKKGGFCEDCTKEYQAKMIECGKCENPDVVFINHHGDLIGIKPGVALD